MGQSGELSFFRSAAHRHGSSYKTNATYSVLQHLIQCWKGRKLGTVLPPYLQLSKRDVNKQPMEMNRDPHA